ncbi:hypothetical protein DEU56DRAFT_920321 [Suillus clintonianus]|uniref:uncharacterized protein n=1 Tax=Suillus clintonianus TaxID=1904413 RepID=UPI001B867651|nr:uncharacterized protein DEU56DRAFT_920321 [Suillus clintonianus]KAG2109525.1 hypothetical protein DEU56DRAFT_920321 [Suillus clintonianus]
MYMDGSTSPLSSLSELSEDDDDMSSLSSLSEMSEDGDGEAHEVVTDGRLVSQAAAAIKGEEKSHLRKVTAVPHPKTVLLKPSAYQRTSGKSKSGKRKSDRHTLGKRKQQQRLLQHIYHDLQYWADEAPVYKLQGVNLQKLQSRTKNAPKDKEKARAIIREMESWESDGASGVFQDEVGNTLVAYFGRRVKAEVNTDRMSLDPVAYNPGPKAPSALGRSPACLDKAERDGKKVYSDGLKRETLDKVHVATQLLVHHIGMEHAKRDGRHDKGDFLMRYPKDCGPPGGPMTESEDRQSFVLEGVEYVYHDYTFTSETTGVLHLVHGWPDQAHDATKYGIHPSKNMVSGPHGAPQVHAYFNATETLALRLAVMFRKAFPEFYKKYRKAFDAGKWTVVDPGPFLGRVIVWKLSVSPHQDGLDEGPAVIFPMGRFEGGECYLPDLKLKLSYRPGEVIILMAGALYHSIGEWTPAPGVSKDGLTPGRIGNVWFFPHSSYEVLKDKPANWALQSAGGTITIQSHT